MQTAKKKQIQPANHALPSSPLGVNRVLYPTRLASKSWFPLRMSAVVVSLVRGQMAYGRSSVDATS